MSRGTITVDGASLQYVREGQGPPLVVVGSAAYYPKAFSARTRDHFECIFVDSRHFVPTYRPKPEVLEQLTLNTFADDIEAVRQHLNIDRMAVLGHSVHAQIALAYACKYPHRTSQLILVAGVPYAFSEFADEAARFWGAEASPGRKSILAQNERDLNSLLSAGPPSRSFAIGYRARGPLYWADPSFDATAVLEGLENGPAFDRLAAALPSKSDVRRALEQVPTPILVVLGRLDFAIPYTVWQGLIDGLKNVTCILMDADSHNPQTEAPDRFDPKLVEWFESTCADEATRNTA